ncbi:MAG: hypothetical protein OXS35_08690 [Dehalococcoidia bacterium]|nr:hypothetical protein [Dehalococcoidia bacterium]
MKQTILDILFSDETGMPESYTEDEIAAKSIMVFRQFLNQQQSGLVLAAV